MTQTSVYDDSAYLGDDPGLTRLLDNVQGMVPAVLLPVVKLVAWNTIEEFYIRSTWRRELVTWCIPEGADQVDFNPFDGDWLVAWVLDVRGLTHYRVRPPAVLQDMDCPAQGGERRGWALLALKPSSFDAEFDSLLYQNWFETILDGCLYRLYAQPAKPYSNPQLAQYHARMFRAGCQRARAVAMQDYTDGPGRWRFPMYANGRRKN
jgi:hypothetical protein